MITSRQLPLPGSPEARNLGCTCPEADPGDKRPALDDACPLHGLAATARERAGEDGPIDAEGDIVDSASEPELRRD
jgi:hypothetical protein